MAEISKEEFKKWSLAWKNASSVIKAEKESELRSPDYYERNMELINEMLEYACEEKTVRLSSGLMEMQKIFSRLNPKNNNGTIKE